MIRKVAEEHHHSAEEVLGYLQTALDIVEQLDVEAHTHEIAFSKAVDLLAAKQIWHEQVQADVAPVNYKLHAGGQWLARRSIE